MICAGPADSWKPGKAAPARRLKGRRDGEALRVGILEDGAVIVEDAVSGAHDRSAVADDVPGKPGARTEVVVVRIVGPTAEVHAGILQHAGSSGHRIDFRRIEVRVAIEAIGGRHDHVVAKAKVQRERRQDPVVVLHEGAVVPPAVGSGESELRLPSLTAPRRNVARPKPVLPVVSCGLPLIARVN